MTATPPEAKPEYSRAPSRSRTAAAISPAVLAGGVAGASLLLVAEFLPLYDEQSAASRIPLHTAQTGTHHAYALIPVALLAFVLAVVASRPAGRVALLALGALGALGILSAVIALTADLPDAQATGLAAGVYHHGSGFSPVKNVPQIGLYLETLGAAVLVITSGAGLLLRGSRRAPPAAA